MMAEKWVDRAPFDDSKVAPAEEDHNEPPGRDQMEAAFNAEGDVLFDTASSLQVASSNESDDRKPAARPTQPHPFDVSLDSSLFDLPEQEPPRKRSRTDDTEGAMPSLDDTEGVMPDLEPSGPVEYLVPNVARMPRHEHPGQLCMGLELPYSAHADATPRTVFRHPDLHASHDPYTNSSPGYAYHLLRSPPTRGMHQRSHGSPHYQVHEGHRYPQQHMMHHPQYYSFNNAPVAAEHYHRHAAGSPDEGHPSTETSTGENLREFRRGPSSEELENAKTPRARTALQTWYQRLEDLYRYKVVRGDCEYSMSCSCISLACKAITRAHTIVLVFSLSPTGNVPQKYQGEFLDSPRHLQRFKKLDFTHFLSTRRAS